MRMIKRKESGGLSWNQISKAPWRAQKAMGEENPFLFEDKLSRQVGHRGYIRRSQAAIAAIITKDNKSNFNQKTTKLDSVSTFSFLRFE